MSDFDHDPTRDAELADAWSAFAHLLAAAETPCDVEQLSARIAARVQRRARRRRLRIGMTALAVAASLLLMLGLTTLRRGDSAPQTGRDFAAAAPAKSPETSEPSTMQSDHTAAQQSPSAQPSAAENLHQTLAIEPWDDELAAETASLAEEFQTVEHAWHERPDSIALLQTRIDQFEQEMAGGEL